MSHDTQGPWGSIAAPRIEDLQDVDIFSSSKRTTQATSTQPTYDTAREDNRRNARQEERAKEGSDKVLGSGESLNHPRRSAVLEIGHDVEQGHLPQHSVKETRTVDLQDGHVVLEIPVPNQVSQYCKDSLKDELEFSEMRYTAATCQPDDFEKNKYTLRQQLYKRETELFIGVTMYNEDRELLYRSLQGVFQNIKYLCSLKEGSVWGKDGWKKIVVAIISDGRNKINTKTLCAITALGVYTEHLAVTSVENDAGDHEPIVADIYEYSTQVPINLISPYSDSAQYDKNMPPVQLLFCLKRKNQKKINSHRWFFNAFGRILNPNVCVLLDVGTKPGPESIYHLWRAFHINPNVGGACGEIVAMKGIYGENLVNPLVATQNFEYKMSNILDKSLESVFGYITVLPGAFSAYRYEALQNDEQGEGPLQKYFMGDLKQGQTVDIFTANMYLAEDRILCWELVSKRKSAWILQYVKSAYAETDVPSQLPEFISQRRRWLNGAFFAAVYSVLHMNYINRSSHTPARKFWITVEMIYQLYNLLFAWFALGNYYIAFVILSTSLEFISPAMKTLNASLNHLYISLIIMSFLLALGNRPQQAVSAYTILFFGFGILMVYMTAASFIVAYRGLSASEGNIVSNVFTSSIARDIIVSLISTYGLYFSSSFIAGDPWHMFTSFIQYLLFSPAYISVLNVYAFANIHDISWGTKEDTSTDAGVVSAENPAKINKNSSSRSRCVFELTVPSDATINMGYKEILELMKRDPIIIDYSTDPMQTTDFFKSIRTTILFLWILSNAFLSTLVCSALSNKDASSAGGAHGYFSFILYSIAGLALVRFVGASLYIFGWGFGSVAVDFLTSIRG